METENIPKRSSIPVRPTRMAAQETTKAEEKSVSSDTLFKSAISDSMDDAQLKLIPFVERQIELMNNKLLFNGGTPTFDQLNTALSQYEGVLLSLTSVYEMARWDAQKASEAYDEWFASKFIEIRELVNPKDVSASKWYSQKEIEYMVCSKFKEERASLIAEKQLTDTKKSTIERLISGWDAYRWCLITLSKNAGAEVSASLINKDLDESD